jgi:hypothetical protein
VTASLWLGCNSAELSFAAKRVRQIREPRDRRSYPRARRRKFVISRDCRCLLLGLYKEELVPYGAKGISDISWRPAAAGGRCMTERSQDVQDADLRNLLRLISACTLGLWAFAAGILIGTFLFS